MANKGQRMIFEDEYQYLKDLKENYPDPIDITGHLYEYNIEFYGRYTDEGDNVQKVQFVINLLLNRLVDFEDMNYSEFYDTYYNKFIYKPINGLKWQDNDNTQVILYNNDSDNEMVGFDKSKDSGLNSIYIGDNDGSTEYITVTNVNVNKIF